MGNVQGAENPTRIMVHIVDRGYNNARGEHGGHYVNPTPPPLLVPGVISEQEWTQKIGEADTLLMARVDAYVRVFTLIVCTILPVFFMPFWLTIFFVIDWIPDSIGTRLFLGLWVVNFYVLFFGLLGKAWIQRSYNKKIIAVFKPWVPRGVTTRFGSSDDDEFENDDRAPSTFLAFNLVPVSGGGAGEAYEAPPDYNSAAVMTAQGSVLT